MLTEIVMAVFMESKEHQLCSSVPAQPSGLARPSVLVGLIGAGIQASRSPRLHEQEAGELGVRCLYQLIDIQKLGLGVEALPRLLDAAQWMGFAGVNVTHPCKQAVIPLLDVLTEDAAAIGAVNTVVFDGGKRVGHNTDWRGFAESFMRELADLRREVVVLLGGGGAGAAVAYAAMTLGARRLAIYDLDIERAGRLADNLCRRFGPGSAAPITDLAAEMAVADGLIQATPVGMVGHPGMPLPPELLRADVWVAEVVYFPLETELLRRARALGCRVMDGGGMAAFQAAEALRLFTRLVPDRERMMRHFEAMNASALE
jgi:shikimate dehydrogenase